MLLIELVMKYYFTEVVLFFVLLKNIESQSTSHVCDINQNFTYCNFRDEIYPTPIFKLVSGYWCYAYLPKFTFKNATPYKASLQTAKYNDGLIYKFPFSWVNKSQGLYFYYDYTNENSARYVNESFAKEEYYQNWVNCSEQADECCSSTMTNENICTNKNNTCPAIWDTWDCFPETALGETVVHTCPSYEYTYWPHSETLTNQKTCFTNGTWNPVTNYDGCPFEKTTQSYDMCDLMSPSYKYCNYRDEIYPLPIFKWVSGYNCYFYGPSAKFKNYTENKAYGQTVEYLDGRKYVIPYSRTNGTYFYYDYTNPEYAEYVRDSLSSEIYYQRWIDCSKKAMECCESSMSNTNICPDSEYQCPMVWDGWSCFPRAKKGEVIYLDCPPYAADAPCIQQSSKECFTNGTWQLVTNYETCKFANLYRARHYFHAAVLGFAAIFCVPPIIIFFVYQPLRITRVILHRNLLMSIVIKNIFVMTTKLFVTIPSLDSSSIIEENGVPCRMLAFFERLFINAMYACMLMDGFYLHKSIVRVFSKEPNIHILYGVIAVFSLGPAIAWAIAKATLDNIYCWVVDQSGRQWILDGSRYLMLGINTLFLLDILRVFIMKMKNVSHGSNHTKVTLRATSVLLPLFLIQFAMMTQRPEDIPCVWDSVFYYFSYSMDSLQGIMVALLYCYLNKEVQSHLKRTYDNYKFARETRQRINNRKTTTTTIVQGNNLK